MTLRALLPSDPADRAGNGGFSHNSPGHHFYAAVTSATYPVYAILRFSTPLGKPPTNPKGRVTWT